MPTMSAARHWLERWDRQQEVYVADREERFAVIADVVAHVAGRPDPVIVDLGAGPGSLSARLLDHFPSATVVAVDADPLLLGLARAAYGDRPGLRFVDCDLRTTDWTALLDLPRPADAIVSTTALHWLTRDELGAVYGAASGVLAPGGALVNGDHLNEPASRPRLDALTRAVRDRRAERAGVSGGEEWRAWWDAVGAAPELAELVGERGARPVEHSEHDVPSLDDHLALLRAAGFSEISPVWQHGDDRVLVALR